MTLSPFSSPFFCCSSFIQTSMRNLFLDKAKNNLSHFDCKLFCAILSEWESCPLLSSCFSLWKNYVCADSSISLSSLHVLMFNVRGLDVRWQEVLLLISSSNTDIVILLETGRLDLSFYYQSFSNFKLFYQLGENRNGGVLILVRSELHVKRVDCSIPNVCIIDVKLEDECRIVGVYAPDSRSWCWQDLSPLVSDKCIVFGDFNVDLEQDGIKAEGLLDWADSLSLSPFVPDCPTSLRSDRSIDYAFSNIPSIVIQKFNTNTTSDHFPILSILPMNYTRHLKAKSIHWKVFNLFTEYTCSYWEKMWSSQNFNASYNDYIKFLHLLIARCTVFFPLNKYRIAIPPNLRCFMSYVRALSFRLIRTNNSELKKHVYYLKKQVKAELKMFVSSHLSSALHMRHSSSSLSVSFWSKVKRFIKPSSSSLVGFISPSGVIIKDSVGMCDTGADFYEDFFRKSENIVRPHPYVDAPFADFDNKNDPIPTISLEELTTTVNNMKKKKIS
jgi:hypothetical protein